MRRAVEGLTIWIWNPKGKRIKLKNTQARIFALMRQRAHVFAAQWTDSHRTLTHRGGGGDSAYERDGDARRKFWIKPLKETDRSGRGPSFFLTPKGDHVKHRQYINFFACNPKRDPSRLNMMVFWPEHPKWDQEPISETKIRNLDP